MSSSLKQKILSGILWQGLERFGNQGISFLISILLARLLAPAEFGVLAILMIFTGLCGVFVDAGFGAALVQRQNLEEHDCCSVFYINIAVGVILYFCVFTAAPFVADFYNSPDLCPYLRVIAIIIPIRALGLVQRSLLNRNMLFHLSFRISWAALLSSGTVAVIMAYHGFGAWALVTQQIINAIVSVGFEWMWVKWRPQLLFNWQTVKEMFRFGWKLFVSAILDASYQHIYAVMIGKFFTLTYLSYYNRGQSIPHLGVNIINSTVGSVIFPAFAQVQNDRVRAKILASKAIKNIMFMTTPILAMLLIFTKPLISILLTEKWLPCVTYMQLFCLVVFFWPLHTLNLQIYTAFGRSDVFLILETIKKIQTAVMIFVTYRYGIVAMIWGQIFFGFISFIENSYYNRNLINYSPFYQILDFLPFVFAAAVSGGISYFTVQVIVNPLLKIIVGWLGFSILYIVVVYVQRKIPSEFIDYYKKFCLLIERKCAELSDKQ